MSKLESLRQTIGTMLVERGKTPEFDGDTSLFDSGLLDSMSALKILMELETLFDLDLSDPDFDVSQIDTFDSISGLVRHLEAA